MPGEGRRNEPTGAPCNSLCSRIPTAPGRGFLEHALDHIHELLGRHRRLALFAQASTDPERYARLLNEALRPLDVQL